MVSKLEFAKSKIQTFFDSNTRKVYQLNQLRDVLETHRKAWNLAGTPLQRFVTYLQQNLRLREVRLDLRLLRKQPSTQTEGNAD